MFHSAYKASSKTNIPSTLSFIGLAQLQFIHPTHSQPTLLTSLRNNSKPFHYSHQLICIHCLSVNPQFKQLCLYIGVGVGVSCLQPLYGVIKLTVLCFTTDETLQIAVLENSTSTLIHSCTAFLTLIPISPDDRPTLSPSHKALYNHGEKLSEMDVLPYWNKRHVPHSKRDNEAIQMFVACTKWVTDDDQKLKAPVGAVMPNLRSTERKLLKKAEAGKSFQCWSKLGMLRSFPMILLTVQLSPGNDLSIWFTTTTGIDTKACA